jgi:hypothetical protein
VQTYFLCGAPFSTTRTRWTLGAQIRLDFLLEWLTLLPEETPLLQTSQYFAIDLNTSSSRITVQTAIYYHY